MPSPSSSLMSALLVVAVASAVFDGADPDDAWSSVVEDPQPATSASSASRLRSPLGRPRRDG
jgi:hypothetical protein